MKKAIAASFALALSAAAARAATSPAPASKLSDNEIVDVLRAANDGEIEAARVAQNRASNSDVSMFSRHMIDDHTASRDEVERLNIRPARSEISDRFREAARFENHKLDKRSGASFDRSYIRAQVRDHEKLLATIDEELIPDAHDDSLQTLLRATRSIVARHLDEARRLDAQLQGK